MLLSLDEELPGLAEASDVAPFHDSPDEFPTMLPTEVEYPPWSVPTERPLICSFTELLFRGAFLSRMPLRDFA